MGTQIFHIIPQFFLSFRRRSIGTFLQKNRMKGHSWNMRSDPVETSLCGDLEHPKKGKTLPTARSENPEEPISTKNPEGPGV